MNIKKLVLITALSTSWMSVIGAETVDLNDILPTAGETGEASPNVWLTLDDSGSMAVASGGWVPYNPSLVYQIPTDSVGNPVKTIADLPNMPRVFSDPFRSNATQSLPRAVPTACANSVNCRIWGSFYRERFLTLKSSLAIVFTNPIVDKMRIGYQVLNNRARTTPISLLPVKPLSNSINKVNFYSWLFQVRANGGTPLRGALSRMRNAVQPASRNTSSPNNPFLNIPGNVNSGLDYCRRNYNIHLSDGGWNNDRGFSIGNIDNTPVTLPDGTTYTPFLPYSDNNRNYVSDITFRMWATDLDNNSSTDTLEPYYPEVFNNGGTPSVQTLGGNPYWHPYNNPATWQHISTYGITINMNPTLSINKPRSQAEADSGIGITPGLLTGTTTFGGNIAPNDIIHSALNGRGQYYDVIDSNGLIEAFNEILSDIDQISSIARGNSGSISANYEGQNNYIVTQYDPSDYSGNVISYPLYNGNKNDTSYVNSCFTNPNDYDLTIPNQVCDIYAWDAQSKLDTSSKPFDSRVILTSNSEWTGSPATKVTAENLFAPFVAPGTPDGLTADQSAIFYAQASTFTGYTAPADLAQITTDMINYVRGDRSREMLDTNGVANPTGLFRTRGSALGDIGRSSVRTVGVPTLAANHPLRTSSSFVNFYQTYKKREPIVYVGANDGMIHAFRNPDTSASNYNIDKGDELFAYVPEILMSKLPHLAVDGGSHQAYVDGKLNAQSITFNATDWYTILLSSLGAGSKGFVTLDVTDPISYIADSKPIARWEYGEIDSRKYADKKDDTELSNIGNIFGEIATMELQDGTWAAITGNGYNSERNRAVLIVVNLETGETIQELEVPRGFSDDGTDGQANGLSPVYFISTDNDGVKITRPDRAYAGDLQGNLWVFDLTNSDKNGGIAVVNSKPLFTAVSYEGKRQAITNYPLVVKHPTNVGYMIHFGTGAMFNTSDFTANMTNSVYAIWDDWAPGIKTTPIVKGNDLREIVFEYQTITDTISSVTKNVRTIPLPDSTPPVLPTVWANIFGNGPTNSNTRIGKGPARGWFIDLTDPDNPYQLPSERVWQPAFITYGENKTDAITYISTKFSGTLNATCDSNDVISWLMAFDINDASQVLTKPTLDFDGDGNINDNDHVMSPGSSTGTMVASGMELNGMLLAPVTIESLAPDNVSDICNSVTTILSSADSANLTSSKTCRPDAPSSWLEIKRKIPQKITP